MRKAIFSVNEKYRYTLWREWGGLLEPDGGPYVNFICLNPSTATDTKDDNTIRKCIKFSKRWGYSAMCVTNIFAFRSTDPGGLLEVADPVGPENDKFILEIASGAERVVCAWSQHAGLYERSTHVRQLLKLARKPLHFLVMGGKEPCHPLYLPDATEPQIWEDV